MDASAILQGFSDFLLHGGLAIDNPDAAQVSHSTATSPLLDDAVVPHHRGGDTGTPVSITHHGILPAQLVYGANVMTRNS
ncbi:hypothetical protein GCM10028815_20070 [Mariniluteicoccus flavus]